MTTLRLKVVPTPVVLETPRLILRPLTLDDAEQAQQLFPQWEIVRLLAADSVPWPYPSDGVRAFYEKVVPAVERGDEWYWTIRLKTQPEQIIGAIELCRSVENNRGFWLGLP